MSGTRADTKLRSTYKLDRRQIALDHPANVTTQRRLCTGAADSIQSLLSENNVNKFFDACNKDTDLYMLGFSFGLEDEEAAKVVADYDVKEWFLIKDPASGRSASTVVFVRCKDAKTKQELLAKNKEIYAGKRFIETKCAVDDRKILMTIVNALTTTEMYVTNLKAGKSGEAVLKLFDVQGDVRFLNSYTCIIDCKDRNEFNKLLENKNTMKDGRKVIMRRHLTNSQLKKIKNTKARSELAAST